MAHLELSVQKMIEGRYAEDGTWVEVVMETHQGSTLGLKARFFMLGEIIHRLQDLANEARKIRVAKGDPSARDTMVDHHAAGELTKGVEILKDPNSTDVILRVTRRSGAAEHIRLTRDIADGLFAAMKTLNPLG